MNIFEYDVIIPTYNRPKELLSSTKSIILQTLPPKKIIVVNDGSASCYSHCHTTLNSLLQPTEIDLEWIDLPENHGVSAARNFGIEKATSTFIAFNDDDDFWDAQKSEVISEYFKRHPNTDIICHSIATPAGEREGKDAGACSTITLWSLALRNPLPIQAMFARRKSVGNIRFNTELSHSEDYDFVLKLVANGLQVSKVNALLSKRGREICSTGGLSEDRLKMRLGELSAKGAMFVSAKSWSHRLLGILMIAVALFKVSLSYTRLAAGKAA